MKFKYTLIFTLFTLQCISQTTKTFNPEYMPFYGNLNMKTIQNLNWDNNASGPANPLEIECYPNYSDKGTGIYYYFSKENGFECIVNVSIFQKGFFNHDTNQRINSLILFNENSMLNDYFPFKIGSSVKSKLEEFTKHNSELLSTRINDYLFWIVLDKDKKIYGMKVERLYCKMENEKNYYLSPPLSLKTKITKFKNIK